MKHDYIKRRSFLAQSGLLSAAVLSSGLPAWGTYSETDKHEGNHAGADGAKHLYERGTPTTYFKSRDELQYIGMPVGGIGCGMVYLGGDGRLWLWDVFNKNQSGVIYKNIPWHEKIQNNFSYVRPFDGANYVVPVKDVRPLRQEFIMSLEYDSKTIIRRLHNDDWPEIAFEATYPIATVRYIDKDLPVNIILQAYSPFIPLNAEDSGLPATIMSFSIENKSTSEVKVSIAGLLENKSAIVSAEDAQYTRVNKVVTGKDLAAVLESTESFNWADETFVNAPDYGNFCLASFNDETLVNTSASATTDAAFFTAENKNADKKEFDQTSLASVCNHRIIKASEKINLNYAIAWYFPNLILPKLEADKLRFYSVKFKSSAEVAQYLASDFDRLSTQTTQWCNTWKDSSLPHWFLERTFLNISTLATTTSHRFASGRFYAWEGIGSCPGTCNHVWQYAQAVARIFPSLERDTRERVDLGIAFHNDGHIGFRGEYDTQPSIDGQAGRVLGIYREHQMTNDNQFLNRNWPKTKMAIAFILKQDTNNDGMVDTQLENTLDAKWPGEIAWIVGLCIAAVKAGQKMAEEMHDASFAATCQRFVEQGQMNIEKHLFNGEYFIHRPDAVKGKTVLGSYNTCHIDQVYGQSWAYQVGLGRILDEAKTKSALRAMWKYNFKEDVGPYLQTHHGGRPYALPGEGGMLMNTNPHNDPLPYGVKDEDAWQVTYFHECMSGFEHQAASHYMAEGMTDEALILTKAIHDRYHAKKRNPFNEVECSDHYARAMASYNTFITACGFEYHGPQGYIKFAPKINANEFKAAFTAAEGWGSYQQTRKQSKNEFRLEVKSGFVELETIAVEVSDGAKTKVVTVTSDKQKIPTQFTRNENTLTIHLPSRIKLNAGSTLTINV